MSWIHVEDLASLLLLAVSEKTLRGPLNAVSPNPVTNTEFTKELSAVLHRPALFKVPASALRLIYGEMAEMVLGGQRVEPRAIQSPAFKFRYPNLRGALQNLLA